ncbi:MAG: translation elongation factor Ts [Anaerolineae bacterium]|nr:translation elongation factor Ts [Anaerolineae bacterium]
MTITAEMIKGLRERTSAGVLDCKRALEQAQGDIDRAIAILREQGLVAAAKKAARVAREGLIEAYVHPGSKVASLVEVNCETDFVARTPEFRALAHDLAMQIAAARPLYVSMQDVPAEVAEAQRAIFRAESAVEGKPKAAVEEEAERRLRAFFDEVVLLQQPFIKDQSVSVADLITQNIARLGENIVVRRFARFAIGEE